MPLPIDDRTWLMVLTGAGVSAESGLPTFRDAGGLWESHPIEDVATLLVTQNVDGLHRRAGSRRVIELHGSLFHTRCSECERPPFPDESRPSSAPAVRRVRGARAGGLP